MLSEAKHLAAIATVRRGWDASGRAAPLSCWAKRSISPRLPPCAAV